MITTIYYYLMPYLIVSTAIMGAVDFIGQYRVKEIWRLSIVIAVAVLISVPVHNGVSVDLFFNGIFNKLSVSSLLLFLVVFARQWSASDVLSQRSMQQFYMILVLLALIVYPLSILSFTRLNLYYTALSTPHIFILLLAIGIIGATLRNHFIVFWAACCFIVAYFGGYDGNIWNVMIDPIASLFAVFALLITHFSRGDKCSCC